MKKNFLITILLITAFTQTLIATAATKPPHVIKSLGKGESPVIFWTSECSYGPIELFVNNVYQGDITRCYNSTPSCAADGCVTVIITGTSNVWRAQTKDGTRKWASRQVTLANKSCNSERLL